MQTSGLESQMLALQKFFKEKEFKLFHDEAISGSKSSRPALNSMMDEVRKGNVKQVVVFSFSRFSRSCTHLLYSLEEFKKHNTQFISLSENIDTSTPVGNALLAVLGSLSQLEKDLIRERVICGLKRARANGV